MAASSKELQFRELKDTITQLNQSIAAQSELIVSLQKSLEASQLRETESERQNAVLKEQVDYLTKKLFGTSSERRHSEVEGQINLFNEAEQEIAQETKDASKEINVKSHSRKPKTTLEEKLKGILVKDVLIPLEEEEQFCPECGTKLEVIGKEFIRHELEYIPAKVKVKKYYSIHYGCPECKKEETPVIIKAPKEKALIKHSLASSTSVAWTMCQKYANGLPLYRQEKDWKQYGIELSRNTLAHWVIYCAMHYFKPMYDYFHRKLLEREFIMADETRIQVLKEEDRRAETDSFMWLYRTGEDGLEKIILYEYSQTRSGENAAAFLKGFKGYLTCDGYQGYNKIPDVKRCCCWAHVRRYMIDAVPKGHQYDYSNPAVQGVEFCNKLFQYEDSFKKKGYSYEKIKEMRLQKEKPILEAFWSWIENQHPVRNSRMDKAVQYVVNRRPYLETYLEDGRCSFSNNLSENAIRPFTVGRNYVLY